MSSTPRLQGGSASESVGHNSRGMSSMTQEGVDIFFAKKDKNMQVRILPARDNSYSPEDSAFATSVVPYRRDDGAGVDTETQTELFTSWFVMVRGYRFFGNTSTDFLSPLTLASIPGVDPMMARDPVNDIRQFCFNNEAYKPYTEKGSGGGQFDALVPLSQVFILMNALVNDGEKWHPEAEIYGCTSAAFEDLKEALAVRRHEGCTNIPLDPVWGKYMLGDVTSLEYGAVANISKRLVGTVKPWCFDYTTARQQSTGFYAHPMVPGDPSTNSILQSRKDLLDSVNVLKFLSYQDIVNLIVADGSIPYDLIAMVCGNSCDMPNPPKQNTTTSDPGSQPGGAPAQPAPTPPGAAAPPASAPPGPSAAPGAAAPPASPAAAPPGAPAATPPGATPAAAPPGGVPGGAPAAAPPGGLPGGAPAAVPGGASAGPPPGVSTSAPPATAQDQPTTTAPSPEAPTAPASTEEVVWVSLSGNVVKKPRSEVQALIDSGQSFKVMSADQSSGWVEYTQLGFTPPQNSDPAPPPAEQPAAPTEAPAPPPAAEAPAPEQAAPTQPAEPASEAAPPSGDASQEAPLTDEELKFVADTQALITTAPDQVDGDTLTRFTTLNARGVKSGQITPAG